MSTPPVAIDLEGWAVALVLIGMPLVNVLRGFLPPSRRLWAAGDHEEFNRVWGTIIVVRWLGVAIVVALLARSGIGLDAIGLVAPSAPLLWGSVAVAVAGGVGYAVVVFRSPPLSMDDCDLPAYYKGTVPATTDQRALFLLVSGTAGFCEEFVYRGFVIAALLGQGAPLWLAVLGSTLAFVGSHGLANLNPLAAGSYAVFGLAFAAIFLLSGSLLPTMAIHGAYDALAAAYNTDNLVERSKNGSPLGA